MNVPKYILGSSVVFVVMFLLEYVFHGIILKEQYDMIAQYLRSQEAFEQRFMSMVIGYLIFAFTFCYVFIKGYEGKGIGEGIRYGIIIGVGFGVASAFINYTVWPITGWIMLGYVIGYPIMTAIMGAFMAMLYKPKK